VKTLTRKELAVLQAVADLHPVAHQTQIVKRAREILGPSRYPFLFNSISTWSIGYSLATIESYKLIESAIERHIYIHKSKLRYFKITDYGRELLAEAANGPAIISQTPALNIAQYKGARIQVDLICANDEDCDKLYEAVKKAIRESDGRTMILPLPYLPDELKKRLSNDNNDCEKSDAPGSDR
jgi:DNA-binding PadR family transcriptional regulator